MPTFRCGRISVARDRTSTKIHSADGGGSRQFQCDLLQSTHYDIHCCVRKMFDLPRYQRSYLYDFRCQPIRFNQYKTFHEYIKRFGLLIHRTVIYLGTYEVDSMTNRHSTSFVNCTPKRSSVKCFKSNPRQSHVENIPPNTIHESIDLRVPDDDDDIIILDDQNQVFDSNYSPIDHDDIIVLGDQVFDSNYSPIDHDDIIVLGDQVFDSNYSPIDENRALIENIEILIRENSSNDTFIQLHKIFCMIHGCISCAINSLNEKFQLSNKDLVQSEIKFYSENLSTVFDLCQSAKVLIDLHRDKFNHLQTFSTIVNSFNKFFTHIEMLKNQWMERINKRSIDHDDSRDWLQVLPTRTINDHEIEQNHAVFDDILKLFKSSESNFEFLIKISIDQIESLRRTTNLHNELSICHTKRILLNIKDQFITKLNELDNSQSLCDSDLQLNKFCRKTLYTLQNLFHILDRHQIKVFQADESRYYSN